MRNNFFDYIYYRITKAYFKWDGRTGGTAIVAISFIETLTIVDLLLITARLFFDKYFFAPYVKLVIPALILILFGLVIYNYRKYNGTYNRFKSHWKDETFKLRFLKGLLVVIVILLPIIPLVLIGILAK